MIRKIYQNSIKGGETMKLIECIKIFDMNPPSFTISNTKKEVEDMLVGTPVVLHKVGSAEDDFELDDVVGYVDMIVPSTSEDEIYGNVFIFKDNVEIFGDFVNYCGYVDENYNFTKVTAISIK